MVAVLTSFEESIRGGCVKHKRTLGETSVWYMFDGNETDLNWLTRHLKLLTHIAYRSANQ